MAFTKEQKREIVVQYTKWLKQSQAVFMVEYAGMTMKDIDTLRKKVRETGCEIHVVKNTLMNLAFQNVGITVEDKLIEGTSLAGFAFTDAPALAKVLTESIGKGEIFKIKGGYLDNVLLKSADVKSLAELPPLPVMRAKLLGTLLAPAGQLVRTLAEPARSVAAVLKSYSEKDATQAAV